MINRIRSFFKVLKGSKHPGKIILAQFLVKSGLNKLFTIKLDGYKIHFSRSALAVTLFSNPGDRHDDEDFLKKILKAGDVYVDVGANIGTLVLAAAASVGDKGKAIGIEPHPATYKYLESNIVLNGFRNISIINAAVGNKQGTVHFSNINSDDQNKVIPDHAAGIEVKLDTLDNLLQDQPVIDLLKIDVEGYEKFVLEGAAASLAKSGIVLYESWEKHFSGFGYTTADVMKIFTKNGFKLYKFEKDILKALPENYVSANCENLVAVKDINRFSEQYNYTVKA